MPVVFEPVIGFQDLEAISIRIGEIESGCPPRGFANGFVAGTAGNAASVGVHLLDVARFHLNRGNSQVAGGNVPRSCRRLEGIRTQHLECTASLQIEDHARPFGDGVSPCMAVHQRGVLD